MNDLLLGSPLEKTDDTLRCMRIEGVAHCIEICEDERRLRSWKGARGCQLSSGGMCKVLGGAET